MARNLVLLLMVACLAQRGTAQNLRGPGGRLPHRCRKEHHKCDMLSSRRDTRRALSKRTCCDGLVCMVAADTSSTSTSADGERLLASAESRCVRLPLCAVEKATCDPRAQGTGPLTCCAGTYCNATTNTCLQVVATANPTPSPTAEPTPTPTALPTSAATKPGITAQPTAAVTPAPTTLAIATPAPTAAVTPAPTPASKPSVITAQPTSTVTPAPTAVSSVVDEPTAAPTAAPTMVAQTEAPTAAPTAADSVSPTAAPTAMA